MLRNPSGIDRPHPQINSFQYWELRVLWLLLRGECFRIPIYESSSSSSSSSIPSSPRNTQHAIRNTEHAHRASLAPSDGERAGERGSPLSTLNSQNHQLRKILILDPSRFHHIIEHGQLLGWRYTALGPQAPLESQVFLPEEVWHDKLPNPFDFWRGLSPPQGTAPPPSGTASAAPALPIAPFCSGAPLKSSNPPSPPPPSSSSKTANSPAPKSAPPSAFPKKSSPPPTITNTTSCKAPASTSSKTASPRSLGRCQGRLRARHPAQRTQPPP